MYRAVCWGPRSCKQPHRQASQIKRVIPLATDFGGNVKILGLAIKDLNDGDRVVALFQLAYGQRICNFGELGVSVKCAQIYHHISSTPESGGTGRGGYYYPFGGYLLSNILDQNKQLQAFPFLCNQRNDQYGREFWRDYQYRSPHLCTPATPFTMELAKTEEVAPQRESKSQIISKNIRKELLGRTWQATVPDGFEERRLPRTP
ncbi:uncharacterized protein CIMG_10071 [Coccidioides immitis RS]|uniref:Uncharacterized protein n=3 Tax=Coccidioides immitis TaxID=5501 RepID=A0A0E1RZY7_COCIM|nr:uncharacterized protein CIMG_10071 [Coccidioides immitis RS]EAS27466.1 hypothetical protein CIMG_10071 [Coccidioides immitis RS]KMP09423.1 glutathione-dependent formaldehyde dehydrogenase [Coccidioides immitis RMSCC 2394]KMU88513.1 glutathione-dependent formaldehyde dehydrogenase [Coccidioides immitis H538.4]